MPRFNAGDIVQIDEKKYSTYYSLERNGTYEVTSVRDGPNGQLIKLSSSNYPNTEYKSNNFKLVKANPNGASIDTSLYLVFLLSESEVEGEKWAINSTAMAIFKTEKDAKDSIRARLEENPELVFGVFPLGFVGKVEKPPIKFDYVWKK
jgi:hypothetical protein